MSLTSIFGRADTILIGAVHLPPLPGYPGFPGFDSAIERAIKDARAFESGGFHGIVFENNYDIPHVAQVTPEAADAMLRIGRAIKESVSIPMGISVLWNDYRSALSIAAALELPWVRIPVFVDRVKTEYGIMEGVADEAVAFRTRLGTRTALFTDIHVKHATILNPETIEQSARNAVGAGADALIVTGAWTGDAPKTEDLALVREAVGDFPILCGSGVSAQHVRELFALADGAIVSTSVKKAGKGDAVNVSAYENEIDENAVRHLVDVAINP